MESLSIDSIRQIGIYLCAKDVRSFSCTSKRIRKQISLCSTTPRMFVKGFLKSGNDENLHYGFNIPISANNNTTVHSVRITLNIGGNRKGAIYIRSNDDKVVYNYERYGEVLALNGEQLHIEFNISPNKTYRLYYKTGIGMGNSLLLRDCTIQLFLLGDKSHVYSKAYSFVQKTETIPLDTVQAERGQIYRDAFLSSAEYIIMNGGLEFPPPMVSFFNSHVQESDLTLELIQLIKTILVDWENDRRDFAAAHHQPGMIVNHAEALQALDEQVVYGDDHDYEDPFNMF